MPNRRGVLLLVAVGLTCSLLTACEKEAERPPDAARAPIDPAESAAMAEQTAAAWQLGEAALNQTLAKARELRNAVDALLASPDVDTLEQARAQWRQTALAYQPLRVYAHLAELRPQRLDTLAHLTYSVAAEPIQPGYLDAFGDYPYSGLVHDIGIPITAETLRHQHGMTDLKDATLGLYALRFMLFGAPQDPLRRALDYQPGELDAQARERGFTSAEELPTNRRRELLRLQAQLLVEDLKRLSAHWQAQTEDGLRTAWVDIPAAEGYQLFRKALRSELATTAKAAADGSAMPPALLQARLRHATNLAKALELEPPVRQRLEKATQLLNAEGEISTESRAAAAEAIDQALERLAGPDGDAPRLEDQSSSATAL